MIFCESKRTCNDVEWRLKEARVKATATHGDKDQKERDRALWWFKQGQVINHLISIVKTLLHNSS